MSIHSGPLPPALADRLTSQCGHCFGLCCMALYFSPSDGFPVEKSAGTPCPNLGKDFRCTIHPKLSAQGLKGCIAYDCQGGGQRAAQLFSGADWHTHPELLPEQVRVFGLVAQLQQTLWYLAETVTLLPARPLWAEAEGLITENLAITELPPSTLTEEALALHRNRANALLREAAALVQSSVPHKKQPRPRRDYFGHNFKGAVMDGQDLSLALLIAARLCGCSLRGCCLLGADLRDADLKNCDLRDCVFLTQAQINAAKGDETTLLPPALTRPHHWTA